MQHVFPHQQNPYQPDWQHHPGAHAQTHHQYAQNQAVSAANSALQQQQAHYGRITQNGGTTNGNGMTPAALGGGRGDLDHAGPGSLMSADQAISEENRKVLEWIAQVLNAGTREVALLELSKKREQVGELALILWHSFGEIQHLHFVAQCRAY